MERWVFPEGEGNPVAQRAILTTVEKEIRARKPPETHSTYQRLRSLGYPPLDAKKLIGCCVAAEMFDCFRPDGSYNEERFVAALAKLPDELPFDLDEDE